VTSLTAVEQVYARRPLDSSVVVVDGYGLRLTVQRRHLLLADGIGPHRRERLLPRAQRQVRRIVVLGHTGTLTLDAIRWCADVGIALVQIDTDGRVLMVGHNPARTDSRLLRAQAAAAGSQVGVAVAQQLLGIKLAGHAALLDAELASPQLSAAARELADALQQATGLARCRDLEAQAANVYFSAWTDVGCRFTHRDQARMPVHWQQYKVRTSPLSASGHTPRNAADPINAMLNYGYALAETEARIAALTVGLDPGLGIVHTDRKDRDSLALDLLEPLRPVVERHVLRLLAQHYFSASDFVETRDGRCRLQPPLSHQFAEQLLPELARSVARPAEVIAHLLAGSSPSTTIRLSTPLSRANTTNAQTRGQRNANARPRTAAKSRPTCEKCGTDLYGSARKLCPTCWPVQRREYMRQLGKARAKPPGPAKPTTDELSGGWTLEDYRTDILPGLAEIPLPDIERATGLSNATCSRTSTRAPNPEPQTLGELARIGPPDQPRSQRVVERGYRHLPTIQDCEHAHACECPTFARSSGHAKAAVEPSAKHKAGNATYVCYCTIDRCDG